MLCKTSAYDHDPRAVGRNAPDWAILDMKMPRIDRIETFRLIRARYDLPVIFLASKEGFSLADMRDCGEYRQATLAMRSATDPRVDSPSKPPIVARSII